MLPDSNKIFIHHKLTPSAISSDHNKITFEDFHHKMLKFLKIIVYIAPFNKMNVRYEVRRTL